VFFPIKCTTVNDYAAHRCTWWSNKRTMCAPCLNGLQMTGAVVLSTIRVTPSCSPIAATASMENMVSFGFGNVSAK
jgi:hypothetical protein